MITRFRRLGGRRGILRAGAVATILMVAGCSTTVAGSAVRDPSFKPGEPQPALMNAGNYPTKPLPPLGPAGANGKIVEAHRMAEYLVGPWEVDPLLIDGSALQVRTFASPQSLSTILNNPGAEIAAQNNFVAGFGVARGTKEPPGQLKTLSISLMEFPSPESAGAAAGQFASAFLAPQPDLQPSRPFGIPAHPEALTRTYSETDNTAAVESFTARGSVVIYSFARAQEGNPDIAAQLIAKALDLQLPRLDEFKPTPPDKLAELPLDPTGMVARVLPGPEGGGTIMEGSYQPRAALMLQVDPFLSKKLFDEAGLSEVVIGRMSTMYQAKDSAGAQTLFDGFKAGEPSPDQKPVAAVPGLPSAKCFEKDNFRGDPEYTCALIADRYFGVVYANRDGEAQQRTASQYLMATAK
jgi:hypothetical protein